MKTILTGGTIVLKIHIAHAGVTKSIPLDTNLPIYAVCEHIRLIIREAEPEPGRETKDYGLFLPHEMSKNGLWLDTMKNLVQYILKPGDLLEYRYRYRWLTIRSQDDIKKTLLVDDSWTVSELMILLCAKMGILNHEEYSLIKENQSTEQVRTNTNTKPTTEKEQDKLDKMKKKLQTDDDLNWLNPSQTLRQQSIEEQEVLLIQRKYFFSDMNIDTRDPIQLSLLFIQSKEAILNGKHPVSMLEAEQLAALQCQSELGDINTQKNKLTKMSLKDCVPKDYVKNKGIEKRIVKIYATFRGKDSIEAKREYCALCRSLKTYGITFFLVKEKIKGKSKLIPRLLGVSRDRVLRLDEKTKEILKTWPLTSIRRWAGSFNAFTMDFGEYAPNEYYTAQTNKGEQISQLISGYVDIIIKHQKSQEPQNADGFEESSVAEIKIEPNQAEIVEHRSSFQMKSFEDITKEIQFAITTPTEDISHMTSGLDSSQIDVTCVTSMPHSSEDQTFKSDNGDFDNIKLTGTINKGITIDIDNQHRIGKNAEDRELESAMSFGTSRGVHNFYSNSRNTVNSPDAIRARNHSPDSFMTGGTRICHTVRRLNVSQQALLQNINVNLEKLEFSKQLLNEKIDKKFLDKYEKEEDKKNIQVISKEHAIYNLGSMNTEVVQVLRSSKHAPLNAISIERANDNNSQHLKDIEKSFKIITVHFPSFIDNVRMISDINTSTIDDITEIKTTDAEDDLTEDNPETLIDAARKLADAFSGMLNAVKPQEEERDIDFRKAILDAANKVGEASSQLFRQITFSDRSVVSPTDNGSRLGRLLQNSDRDFEDSLIYLVKSVANATAHLVQAVKTVSQNESSSDVIIGCQKLISPVTHAGLATSQLVTCVKILAPTINQANCTNQILAEIDEVRSTIDNVAAATSIILSNNRSNIQSSPSNDLFLTDVEASIMNVRHALENLEDHLRCGITIVNFAPRIQSLELFLTEYDRVKSFFVHNSTNHKRINNNSDDLLESLSNLLIISGKINEEILFLCDHEQTQGDPLLESQKTFTAIVLRILEINKNLSIDNIEAWKNLHYEIDNLILSLLYEPGTRFISHDQLIHNLYRSAQILITCSHKLITSYYQIVMNDQFTPECSEVIDRSEHILVIMSNLKFDPTNDKTLASFIRESEKLAQSCVIFCRSIHNTIPNTSDDLMIDIMAIAASQTLAECEHMDQTIKCLKPIKAHLELSAISKMLNEQQLENLQKPFFYNCPPKLNLSQLFQISIAILEKMRNNIEQTLPRAHYSTMFEMYNFENSEPSLLVNLYHHFVKMNENIESDGDIDMQSRFKNVIVLMYRLVILADNMLTSYGQNSGNYYPLIKNIDEILSTVSSLQSKSGNIFDKFKSNILNKQNIFRSKVSSCLNQNLESLNSYDSFYEKSNIAAKKLIENGFLCRQNYGNGKLMDNIRNLHLAFDDIAECSESILALSGDTRIIDDFIILSLSLLNFVLEIENSLTTTEDQLIGNRISNKFRVVSESTTKLEDTILQTFINYRGIFNNIIDKLQETRKQLRNHQQEFPIQWNKSIFINLIKKDDMIKFNIEELKQIIEKNQSLEFGNQLLCIVETIEEISVLICEKFDPFEERDQIIYRSIDLSLNIINMSLKIFKTGELINITKKLGFYLKDLSDNVSFLINCVREQIPGYKECSSGLAVIAQLSYDIHEIEFSISSDTEVVNKKQKFEEENKKRTTEWLSKMATSVFDIQTSLESEIIPDHKFPNFLEEFTNYLSELMSLIINFAKKESLISEVKLYVEHANELVDSTDRYLQNVKLYFDNIGIENRSHNDEAMKDMINEIARFLFLFDSTIAKKLLDALERRNKGVACCESEPNNEMANTMSGMITDDDTTILFASAGIKNSDIENYQDILSAQFLLNGEQRTVTPYKKDYQSNMSNGFRNLVQKTAEALVHDTQTLVKNSGDKEKSLATNAETVIKSISNLADECENGFIQEARKSSEMKMLNTIQSVQSALDNTYNDGSTEISRLIVSNSASLVNQDNNNNDNLKLNDFCSIDETIQNIQNRLDRFNDNITRGNNNLQSKNNEIFNLKIDSLIEKLVNHASSILALSSELMRMPFEKLFQNFDQSKSIITNISNQCQAILFDYLESLEELAFKLSSNKINQKIILIGRNLSIQFIKFFQILQKIQKDPNNKFIKSLMLDVFYEIQNGIKTFLEFSEEVQKNFETQISPTRKVSFRDSSPITIYQSYKPSKKEPINGDPLISTKEKILQLNKIASDLKYKNQNLVNNDEAVQLLSFIEIVIRLVKVSTDLIGLSKHCAEQGNHQNDLDNLSMKMNKEIANYFDEITSTIRTCVYGKYRNLEDQLNNIKNIVRNISSKSADLLIIYRNQTSKSSWQQLLQTVATDLRNISKEILQFNSPYREITKTQEHNLSGQTFSYISSTVNSSK